MHRLPAKVHRREIATGRIEPWLQVQPANAAGVTIDNIFLAPDARSYAYSYSRIESSDLFLVEGLK